MSLSDDLDDLLGPDPHETRSRPTDGQPGTNGDQPRGPLPRYIGAQLDGAPEPGRRSEQIHTTVCCLVEHGYNDDEITQIMGDHRAARDKAAEVGEGRAGARLDQLVGYSLGRHRPLHRHVGRSCADAGCPNRPGWMTASNGHRSNRPPGEANPPPDDPTPPPDDEPDPGPAPAAGVDGLRYTDSGNAERLIAAHGTQLRYVPTWRRWLAWDRQRWALDHDDVAVVELAKDVPRRLLGLLADTPAEDRKKLLSWATRSESASGLAATVKLARSLPGVAVHHDRLDDDPMVLNVANGTLDLRTGPTPRGS